VVGGGRRGEEASGVWRSSVGWRRWRWASQICGVAACIPVGARHGRRWPVAGRQCWGPTFPKLSAREGFGCLRLFPGQVGGGLWWLATSAGLVLMCEPISWPKCSGGSPACSTVSVLPRGGQGVATLVSLVVDVVEGGLSARPSRLL
jgi:hypothetical protein